MDEYISRNSIEAAIDNTCAECRDACIEFDGILADCNQCMISSLKAYIHSIPAADVRPVVHAEWEDKPGEAYCIVCPVCGDEVNRSFYNFCPNCGADMRVPDKNVGYKKEETR